MGRALHKEVSIPIWCDYKERMKKTYPLNINKFQFQYGAIISVQSKTEVDKLLEFQFQYGAIIRNINN